MYTKDGWLSSKGVKIYFFIILFATVMGALSSCNTPEPVYYLYITDYEEESVCVEIRETIGNNEVIVCVLDRYFDSRKDWQQIKEAIDNANTFNTSYTASIAYWDMVEDGPQ